MKANASVSHFSFSLIPESSTKDFVMGHYMKRSLKGHAVLTEQMGIWKSSSLLKLLKSGENPWETELYGSERAKAYRKLSLYCVDDNSHSPIRYNNGWLVVRGKWNSIEVERLEKKLGLRIDLGSRPSEPFDGSTKDSFWWKVKKKICIIIWRARTLPFYRKKDIQ